MLSDGKRCEKRAGRGWQSLDQKMMSLYANAAALDGRKGSDFQEVSKRYV